MDFKEQIFDLTIEQVANAQNQDEDATTDLRALIESNTRPYMVVEHVKNNWPTLIDSRGKIIRAIRERKKRKISNSDDGDGDGDDDDDENVLLGDPIAPGKIAGKAKVLLSPYEKPLESGEVLVTRFTEPSWTPIFINAAAVVMEVGGPLQHGAM